MHRAVRLPTKVPRVGDELMVVWDVDGIYYAAEVTQVFVHEARRFFDLRYPGGDADEEYYVDLSTRKWHFADERLNAFPRKTREEPHPHMPPDDYPKPRDPVEVAWQVDRNYYPGVVTDVRRAPDGALFHDIQYNNGDAESYVDLYYRKWRYLGQAHRDDDDDDDDDDRDEQRGGEPRTARDFEQEVAADVRRLIR